MKPFKRVKARRVCLVIAGMLMLAALAVGGWALFWPRIFWARPWPVGGSFNALTDKVEACTTPGGDLVILARDDVSRGSELFSVRHNGVTWGDPQLLTSINSPFHETDPELSHDGRFLFFASDRPGGRGGFDVWVSRRTGSGWGPPLNLGTNINSRFDDTGPTIPLTTNRLIFSSNRPNVPLTAEDAIRTDKELRERYANRNSDLYSADWRGMGPGERVTSYALRDLRQLDEALIERLGGSAGTEAAVQRALQWFSRIQKPDGRWTNEEHGGQSNHDSAATALSLLCMLGRGMTHKNTHPYRENVARGLDFLTRIMTPDGDLRNGNLDNGMYDQGMATMALAEAYGLTGDPALREPLERAVRFILRAQNITNGGWRYKPLEGADTSVLGWQIMALHSAASVGVDVPEETFLLGEIWLDHVGGGRNGGLYGYQNRNFGAAMTAEGMFCRQLMGVSRDDPGMNESAEYLHRRMFETGRDPFFYYVYYATLSLYHYHGDLWDDWNRNLKENLLPRQIKFGRYKGAWNPEGRHAREMGRFSSTAFATLALEVYYRYLPRYEFLHPHAEEPENSVAAGPVAESAGGGVALSQPKKAVPVAQGAAPPLLDIPVFAVARPMAGLNTDSDEAQPAISEDGSMLVFASDRSGTRGGADLYLSVMTEGRFAAAERAAGYLNSAADETDPAFFAQGARLYFSSNRESPSGQWYRLYETRLVPFSFWNAVKEAVLWLYLLAERVKWWLLCALLAVAAIVFLLRQFAVEDARRKLTLLHRCLMVSALIHLAGLLLTAFYKISSEVKVVISDKGMEVAVDVNALAQEKLALDIREDITELSVAENITQISRLDTPVPPRDMQPHDPVSAEVFPVDEVTQAFELTVPPPALVAPDLSLDLPLPETIHSLPEFESMLSDVVLEEQLVKEQAARPQVPERSETVSRAEPLDTLTLSSPVEEVPEIEEERSVPTAVAEIEESGSVQEHPQPDLPELLDVDVEAPQLTAEIAMEERPAQADPAAADVAMPEPEPLARVDLPLPGAEKPEATMRELSDLPKLPEDAMPAEADLADEALLAALSPDFLQSFTNLVQSAFVYADLPEPVEVPSPDRAAKAREEAAPALLSAGLSSEAKPWDEVHPEAPAPSRAEREIESVALPLPDAPPQTALSESLVSEQLSTLAQPADLAPAPVLPADLRMEAADAASVALLPQPELPAANMSVAMLFDSLPDASRQPAAAIVPSPAQPTPEDPGSGVSTSAIVESAVERMAPEPFAAIAISALPESALPGNLPRMELAQAEPVDSGPVDPRLTVRKPQAGRTSRPEPDAAGSAVDVPLPNVESRSVPVQKVTENLAPVESARSPAELASIAALPLELVVKSDSLPFVSADLDNPGEKVSQAAEPVVRSMPHSTAGLLSARQEAALQPASDRPSREPKIQTEIRGPEAIPEQRIAPGDAAKVARTESFMQQPSLAPVAVTDAVFDALPSEVALETGSQTPPAPREVAMAKPVNRASARAEGNRMPLSSPVETSALAGKIPVPVELVAMGISPPPEPGRVEEPAAVAALEPVSANVPSPAAPTPAAVQMPEAAVLAGAKAQDSRVGPAAVNAAFAARVSPVVDAAADRPAVSARIPAMAPDQRVLSARPGPAPGSKVSVAPGNPAAAPLPAFAAIGLPPAVYAPENLAVPERVAMQTSSADSARRPERMQTGRAGRALPFASGISDRAGVSRAGRVAPTVHARLPGPVQSRSVVAPVGESVHTDRLGPIALKHMADQPLPAAAAESEQDENLSMVSPYSLRHQSDRGAVLDRMGGDSATEAAVRRALDWLAQVQEPDGRWQMEKYGGQRGHDPGATGLALLCYLGWGATHTEPGTYRENVQKAIEWLLANKKQNGDFRVPGSENAMYSQGIAALALAEAFGVTGDPALKAPVQSAVDFIVNAQNPSDGGWRYYLQEPGDTSVFAWQIMALRSAKAAGLEVPDPTFLRARSWLDHVAGGHSGGLYGYRDRNPLPSLVAVGMFSRQMLGVEKDDPATRESVAYLNGIPLLMDEPYLPVFYQIYYRTLALYHYQGEAWTAWNRQMKLALVKAQQLEGEYPGSWDPRGLYAKRCGRIVSTALATLTLEVYYRYLPLYTGMEALVGSGPQDIQ